ncbi:MAG: SLBB domain-containing protein [Gemmatimonadota bacterium]|nr:SLBB domain-containing protein [Gemmatimonadota bacterium]
MQIISPRWMRRAVRASWMLAVALGALAGSAPLASLQAQNGTDVAARRAFATRAELGQLVVRLQQEIATTSKKDTRAAKQADLAVAEGRLRDGDFDVGDRINVRVDSASMSATDTFTVKEGRMIEPREGPPVSLHGVLRAELQEYMTAQYARYLRNPNITATPLMRVAILGGVGNSGFFTLPYDMLLSDALMFAGGPGQGADLSKSYVQRGKRKVVEEREFQKALMENESLEGLGVRSGDAIVVGGSPSSKDWTQTLRTVGVSLGLVLTLYGLSKRL